MLKTAAIFVVTLGALSAAATGQVLVEHRFDGLPAGPLPSQQGWHVGQSAPGPEVVDLGDETFRRVLQIYAPASGNSNNWLDFRPQYRGALVVSFDVLTNTAARSLYLLLTPPGTDIGGVFDNATVSLNWGQGDGPPAVRHYAGRWMDIGQVELARWHHVDVVVWLSGPRAGTLDVNLDGGASEAVGLPWRNRFELTPQRPLGRLWLMGWGRSREAGGGTRDRFVAVDNLVITHAALPEPGRTPASGASAQQ